MGFVVSGLSDYTLQNKDLLVKSAVLGSENKAGSTIPEMAKQFGIKTEEMLNYLNVDPILQDGKNCGFTASGNTAFTERKIKTALMKYNDEWCADALLGKWNEYAVRIGAQGNANTLPFEAEISDGVAEGINEKLEKLVWEGATSGHSGTDLIDGFVTLAKTDDSASTVNVTIATGTSVYNAIKAVYMAIPERILDKAVIFVSPAIYRQYIQELVEKNYFHYDPANGEPVDMFFPGTSIKVHKTFGMTGDKKNIYASCYSNMVYGCDLMNDKEEFRFWFSDDNDTHRVKVKFNAGVKTYYPDMVVLGSCSGDLV